VFNVAHRGARAFAPENTLPAFQKALEHGCHMIELDVHASADGIPVVHHDDDLERCTNVAKRYPRRAHYFVSAFTNRQLRALEAGSWFTRELKLPKEKRQAFLAPLKKDERGRFIRSEDESAYRSGAVRIPTLKEVLKFVESTTSLLVNIELKTLPRRYPRLATTVLDLLESMGLCGRTLISSFDHEQLTIVRSRSRDVATALLASDRLWNVVDYLKSLDADAFHPGCYGDYDSLGFGSVDGRLDARQIAAVRGSGRDVNVWTCNDPRQMRKLLRAGVTGIITDYPNRLRPLLRASR
jgi:glycerophosphoryl diester phosphodiesterase